MPPAGSLGDTPAPRVAALPLPERAGLRAVSRFALPLPTRPSTAHRVIRAREGDAALIRVTSSRLEGGTGRRPTDPSEAEPASDALLGGSAGDLLVPIPESRAPVGLGPERARRLFEGGR